MINFKYEFYWDFHMTWGRVFVCLLIYLGIIILNLIIILLTEFLDYDLIMVIVSILAAVAVMLGGHSYYNHADKELAKDDIVEVYSYIVTSETAPIYAETTSGTKSEHILTYCYRGEILTYVGHYKVRTERGYVGYINMSDVKKHEYLTRYERDFKD